jgi:hypothetical protein
MAEKRTIELEIQDNSKSLKAQYKEAVAELQKVSAQYGETSAEAVKAAKAAAELKDQIGFSKDLVDSFNPDAKFNALTRSVGGVLDGFQAFEGALGLVGVESEDLQKTMVRLQSVMALSQGLQGLMEAKDSFKQLGSVAVNALKGIKTGIAATGIGLLLVAVGTLVAYWDDIKEAVSGVSDEQTALNKKTEANLTAAEEKVSALDKQDNILKLQGKSEKQILELKIKELDATIAIAETNLANQKATKKAQVDAAKRNKDILVGILDFITQPLSIILKSIDEVAAYLGQESDLSGWFKGVKDSAANLIFDPDATAKEGDEAIKEAENKLLDLKNQRAGYIIAIRNIEQQGAQDRVNTERGAAQEQIDITRQTEEEKNRLMEEGRAKDLDALRIKYKYEKEEADKNLKENKLSKENYDTLIKQQAESLKLDTKAINDKYDKIEKDARDLKLQEQIKAEDSAWLELQKARNSQREQELLDLQLAYEAKIEAANNNAETEKAITEKYNKEYAAINKKYADAEKEEKKKKDDEEKERIKKLNEYRVQAAQDSLQVVSNLAELFAGKSEKQQKKAFQVQKAVNIANAVIDTYKAANVALASSPPPFNYIAMAAAITAGLVNVKKIASQQFQTSGTTPSGGSNAPTGAAPMTANFNTIGSSGINQLAQLQQTPTQAYVVSGEVTSAQALDRNRVQNATL